MLGRHVVFLFFVLGSIVQNISKVEGLRGKGVKDADQDDVRAIVYMGIVGRYNALSIQKTTCTGVFITKEHILALADCIEKAPDGRFGVFGGSNVLYEAKAYQLGEYITYNDWAILHDKPSVEDYQDIVIITILNPEADPLMKPVHLPNVHDEFYGADVTVVGLGSTDNERLPGSLKSATLNLLSKEKCKRRVPYKMVEDVDDGKIVCSDPTPEVVNKDRGGPLLYSKNTLVGLNLVLRRTQAWRKIPPINIHLKIHSFPFYKDFICDFAGHLLVDEESKDPMQTKTSFCPKKSEPDDSGNSIDFEEF